MDSAGHRLRVGAGRTRYSGDGGNAGLYPLGRLDGPGCAGRYHTAWRPRFSSVGRRITAQRGPLDWGLINRVVPKGKALERPLRMAEQICENAPFLSRLITRSLRDFIGCACRRGRNAEAGRDRLADIRH